MLDTHPATLYTNNIMTNLNPQSAICNPQSDITAIKDALHQSLRALGTFETCALLEHPDGLNIGSHALWLSAILCLTDVLKTKIAYTTSMADFSEAIDSPRNNLDIGTLIA